MAVPLGIALTRTDKLANFVIGFASLLQTIPSLALLALMVPILGLGSCRRLLRYLFIRYYRFYVIPILGWKV